MLLLDTVMEMLATVGEVVGLMIGSLAPRQRSVWRVAEQARKIS